MISFNELGFEEITFDDIRQGDIIGTLVGDCLFIGEADALDTMFKVTDWVSRDLSIVASDDGSTTYRLNRNVSSLGSEVRNRRASFPEEGVLDLLEDVGDWKAGLRFFTKFNKTGWFVVDDYYHYEVNIGWLHELFEAGKLGVIIRDTVN